MRARLTFLGAGLLALALTGCPVTDDYFIDAAADVVAGTGGNEGIPSAGAGGATGSTSPAAGASNGGSSTFGGAMLLAQGGEQAGAPGARCVSSPERCNGRDDNCDAVVDERACDSSANGTVGCTGFVLMTAPGHGYLLCTGAPRDFSQAKAACAAQGMRLVWIESSAENQGLAAKVNGVLAGAEVLIGATDAATEGSWSWEGGAAFWNGDTSGSRVAGSFAAWGDQAPNNGGTGYGANEDCAVLISSSATWGDRRCLETYGYLCEEP